MAQSKRMAAIQRAKAEPFAFVVRAISQPKLTRKQLIALATASLEREQEINAAVQVTGKDRLSCSDIVSVRSAAMAFPSSTSGVSGSSARG